jgi:hypothetical protein
MRRIVNRLKRAKILAAVVGLAAGVLLHSQAVLAFTDSGLQLTLEVDAAQADLKYTLGQDPVLLVMTIRNAAGEPIATSRGFSQIELYNALSVTDPNGVRHVSGSMDLGHKMPPPFFINDQAWGPAETLPAAWVRSATIADLRDLYPMMQTTAGWYTIEARTPFIRFASTGQIAGLGLLGLLENQSNWEGKVASNKLQIYIAPVRGAKLKVQVLESQQTTLSPVAQAPVKVFKQTGDPDFNPLCDMNGDNSVNQDDLGPFAQLLGEVPGPDGSGDADGDGVVDGADVAGFIKSFGTSGAPPQDLWENAVAVLNGTTDLEGWAVWQAGLACLSEDNYVAVAYHLGQYNQSPIATGDAAGWNVSCDDSIVRKITFGTPPPSATGDLNGDGCVDMADYNILIGVIESPPPHDPMYDLNSDGLVNIADARYLVLLFSNPGGEPC